MSELSNDDFFAELEAEIAAAERKSKLKSSIDSERKKAHNQRLDAATRAKAKANFLEAQALIDAELWASTSLTAFFSEQSCDGCGSIHRIFLHYAERQHQPKKPSNKRWVRTTAPQPGLPRETSVLTSITHICADCCHEHGFPIGADALSISSPVSPSPHYHQEDINAQA